jgi:hypothetical protein
LLYVLVNFAYKKLRNRKKDIFQTPKVRLPDGNKKRNKNKIITSLLMHYPE